jgi:hypothetical protein
VKLRDLTLFDAIQPIVSNRRETIIQFVGKVFDDPAHSHDVLGESTCNYPGILWHKTLNELDCQEEVNLVNLGSLLLTNAFTEVFLRITLDPTRLVWIL